MSSVIRDYNMLIGMIDRGRTQRDINAQLADLFGAVKELSDENPKRKIKGSLTIKIDLSVQDGIAMVTAKSEAKLPKQDPNSGLFWLANDGSGLTTQHPHQLNMFPRDADTEDAEVIDETSGQAVAAE